MKCPDQVEDMRPDEVAECTDGLSEGTYAALWSITGELAAAGKGVPLGGDGSNGTIECPPEPGSYASGRMAAVWDRLTEEQQAEITRHWFDA